jgi:hypothetical protein
MTVTRTTVTITSMQLPLNRHHHACVQAGTRDPAPKGEKGRLWVPASPGVRLRLSAKGAQGVVVDCVRCFHTLVDAGFVISESKTVNVGVDEAAQQECVSEWVSELLSLLSEGVSERVSELLLLLSGWMDGWMAGWMDGLRERGVQVMSE